MLSQFFRPKWQHSNLQIRKAAILKLQDETILTQIALSDNEASVRELAIQQLNTTEALINLSKNAKNNSEKTLATQRWVLMLTGGSEKSTNIHAENFILDCKDEILLCALITYSQNENIRQLAISGLRDEAQLIQLMMQNKNPKTWLWIVEKLNSEEALKQALHIANGRDKKTQQLLKNKLEQIKQAQLQQQDIQHHIEQLIQKLEHLLHTESNPLFEGVLLNLKQQYENLKEHCSEKNHNDITQLIAACQHQFTKKTTVIEPLQNVPQAVQVETNNELILPLLKNLESLIDTIYHTPSTSEAITLHMADIQKTWEDIKPTETNSLKKYQALTQVLGELLNIHIKLIENANVIKLINEPHQAITKTEAEKLQQQIKFALKTLAKLHSPNNNLLSNQLNQVSNVLAEQAASTNQKAKELQQKIHTLLEQAEECLQQKQLSDTQALLNNAKHLINNLDKQEAAQFNNTFQRIFNGTKVLENWKNDASDEQRKNLIAQMRALNTPDIDPDTKANTIKTLRAEWKALGHCQHQALWEEFKQLADIAYLPCHEYFEKLKALRQFNTEQKSAICNELEQLINTIHWENTDWRALEKIYASAQNEWKRFTPVDRENHHALQTRFFALMTSIKDKLHEAKLLNRDKMQALIQQAELLAKDTDITAAINTYSQLQQQWKVIGISYRNEQQALWNSFKTAGDALYDKKQHLRQEAEETKQASLQQANDCIKEIETLSQLDSDEMIKQKSTFELAKNTFKSLGSLPKDSYKSCQDKFQAACATFETAMTNAQRLAKTKKYQNLENLSDKLIEAESQPLTTDLFSAVETPANLVKLCQEMELPEKWITALVKRFEATNVNPEAKNQALLLCIEADIEAEINIPTEDAALKMQWQMDKLQKGFGQQIKTSVQHKLDDLYLRWYSQPCWNKVEYKALEKRFLMATKKLQQQVNDLQA